MRNKCLTCGKNAEGLYCFMHKPRKALAKTKMSSIANNLDKSPSFDMKSFFLEIWNKRKKHECENCGKWLGKEPLSYMFDHLLEKNKHPDLKDEEDNIMLVCLECHDLKTRGFITDFVRAKIEEVRKKFNK